MVIGAPDQKEDPDNIPPVEVAKEWETGPTGSGTTETSATRGASKDKQQERIGSGYVYIRQRITEEMFANLCQGQLTVALDFSNRHQYPWYCGLKVVLYAPATQPQSTEQPAQLVADPAPPPAEPQRGLDPPEFLWEERNVAKHILSSLLRETYSYLAQERPPKEDPPDNKLGDGRYKWYKIQINDKLKKIQRENLRKWYDSVTLDSQKKKGSKKKRLGEEERKQGPSSPVKFLTSFYELEGSSDALIAGYKQMKTALDEQIKTALKRKRKKQDPERKEHPRDYGVYATWVKKELARIDSPQRTMTPF